MSATELLLEKAKGLSEPEAEIVLRCIDALHGPSPKPSELRKMPADVREQIISAQFAKAKNLYRDNPDLFIEDWDPPLDYE